MTKKEEIREEGIHRFYVMCRDNLHLGKTLDGYLQYLDSQGVVIKVDRGLPENPYGSNPKIHFGAGCYVHAQTDMVEAGYAATESLIKK